MPRHDAVAEAPLTRESSAKALAAALGGVADVDWVATTGSTNADLLARLAAGADPTRIALRIADAQTHGRGRLGRAWRSGAGRSLAFSCAAPFARADLSGLSLAVGVAVADALDAMGADRADAPRVGLKWPNDVCLVDGEGEGDSSDANTTPWRKLGGILIETAPARGVRVAVIGIGLNLHLPLVADLPYRTAALDERRADAAAASTLDAIAPALLVALAAFERHGFTADVRARFAARDVLAGRTVRAGTARADAAAAAVDPVEGVASGIAEDGALRVRLRDGRTTSISSGEVSVRATSHPDAGPASRGAATC